MLIQLVLAAVTVMITVVVMIPVPPPFFSPSLIAITIMPAVHIMLSIVRAEIALFFSIPPTVPLMIAIPIPVSVSERRISKRDAEIHGCYSRR
jgi:hypothetical protein